MSFRVGQKVVCVDARDRRGYIHPEDHPVSHWLAEGAVYTIRKTMHRKTRLVWINGINRRKKTGSTIWVDSGFFASRFRPVAERKTNISIFTAMLKKAPALASRVHDGAGRS